VIGADSHVTRATPRRSQCSEQGAACTQAPGRRPVSENADGSGD